MEDRTTKKQERKKKQSRQEGRQEKKSNHRNSRTDKSQTKREVMKVSWKPRTGNDDRRTNERQDMPFHATPFTR
jgi:hypothetical protein